MTTQAVHPDHLRPGNMVGPWRIIQVLGRGGSSRVFKVERDGRFYAMKTALLPQSSAPKELSDAEHLEEENAYRQLAREAAALFTYASHPNLLRVYAVDFWPNPRDGYGFLVTDLVEGDNWHEWRWRKPSHAAGLVDTYSDIVRTVGVLHERGVYHRDLKAENILIRRQDGRPFLIDFGTVRLPGALTKTMGIPKGVLHLLPPELLEFTRSEAWKRGVRFEGGRAADLYALGVLLYQALTDRHPFDPELPDKELLAAIASTPPLAPHLLNPLAPRSLSDIAMKLLEKRPEDRYPTTEALLRALEQAAASERGSPAWDVPLTAPEEDLVKGPPDEAPKVQAGPSPESTPLVAGHSHRQTPSSVRRAWLLALLAGLLLGAMGWLQWRAMLAPSPETEPEASAHVQRGTSSMSSAPQDFTPSIRGQSRPSVFTVWLCAVTSLGCPAAQLRPDPERCSEEAQHNTFEVLKVDESTELEAIIDIHQPGDSQQDGIYRDGPIVSRITKNSWSRPEAAALAGTLLYGRLWTGPILDRRGVEVVMGRYTKAVLPDGRELQVCIVLGGLEGNWSRLRDARPGTALLPREVPVTAVRSWP